MPSGETNSLFSCSINQCLKNVNCTKRLLKSLEIDSKGFILTSLFSAKTVGTCYRITWRKRNSWIWTVALCTELKFKEIATVSEQFHYLFHYLVLYFLPFYFKEL